MIAGLALLAVVVVAAGYAGLRPHDLGWLRSRVGGGLAATAAIFVAMQVIQVVVTVANGDQPELSASWTGAGWATAMGALAGYALGIAPAEETFFRGLLLPQLGLKFSRMTPTPQLDAPPNAATHQQPPDQQTRTAPPPSRLITTVHNAGAGAPRLTLISS